MIVTINRCGIAILVHNPVYAVCDRRIPCLFYLFYPIYTNDTPGEINSDHGTVAQASAAKREMLVHMPALAPSAV
jgi:hypothetical protein